MSLGDANFENASASGDAVRKGPPPSDDPRPPRRSLYSRYGKPVFDIVVGGLLFVLSLPLLVLLAVLVRIKVGNPILYRQKRVGRNGEVFELYKFRTMIPDRRKASNGFEGPERRQVHKSPDDPRVVPLGKTLRAWRLDELPQFWNVVAGDMSLVGPRPEMPHIVAEYEPWQHRRHVVKPGITGPWQISDRNGKLMHQCTDLDLEYLDQISLSGDVSLLARTPMAMIGRRKGY